MNPPKGMAPLGKAMSNRALGKVVSDATRIGTTQARLSNLTLNPNISGSLGGQTTEIDPDTGQPITKQFLSPEQQAILEGQQGVTKTGIGKQQQWMSGMNAFNPDLSEEARQRVSDAVFARLTRGMDQRQKQQSNELAQDLYNRGIQFSSDPNSRYQQEMNMLRQQQDEERQGYSMQAYEAGLSEQQAQFGMGQGTRQQQMSDLAAMGQLGSGLLMPNYQETQGVATDIVGAAGIPLEQQDVQTRRRLANASIEATKRRNVGGSSPSGGGTSPFVASY
jgi:hypothetical protein